MKQHEQTPVKERPEPDEIRGIGDPGALRDFRRNLLRAPRTFGRSLIRHGKPTSDRTKSQAVFSNFFLHILPVRTHLHSLKARTTMGLGVATFVLFGLLCITGALLMVYYKPSVDQAYGSMLDIIHVVPTGRLIRNVHRWAAHGMVACVILHMTRAFYTAAYKRPREYNWVIGMGLFVMTLGLSFTGYLLPWDQLAYWAVTIGANIAQSPREITDALGITSVFDVGGFQKKLLLGAHNVGQEALIRFYVLHVMILPVMTAILIAVHFWRIRKDGGLVRPSSADLPSTESVTVEIPEPIKTYGLMGLMKGRTPAVNLELTNTVTTWPNVIYVIGAVSMATTLIMLVLGLLFDAPLSEMANPAVPENPAKAPWYFLGLQELVSYSAFMGGVGIPMIVLLGLGLVPYLDREKEDDGIWFSGRQGRRVMMWSALFAIVVVVGMLCFTVRFGWLRNWHATAELPQIVITLVNPGTVFVFLFALWSILTVRRTSSTRMGAVALFTCFLFAFSILTYFATVHRGPNWDFYWLPSQWPAH